MTSRDVYATLSGDPQAPAREIFRAGELKSMPPGATFLRILGVNYAHLKTSDGGDLYVTEHGLPFLKHLALENWYEEEWFKSKRERLQGTSVVYRVPTKPLADHPCKSIPLVVKWSRVGEDVPLDTFTLSQAINAEFNTPFEEFSLVEELRAAAQDLHRRILTQKPLAIYVPPEKMQLWQTGRSRERILRKVARHVSVEIDILRSYILLYGWIKGLNAVEACARMSNGEKAQEGELRALTNKVNEHLRANGFVVADNKPTHIIVRNDHQGMRKRPDGQLLYALIDYELLARTPEYEEKVKKALRSKYLSLQRDRFRPQGEVAFPPHLKPAQVVGVDYIFSRAESTGGILWVVGKDPELFNYFLPERWRHKQIQLSASHRTFYTQTKDRIHLVWKISRVGDLPPGDMGDPDYQRLAAWGYNCPFEEFALALAMSEKGVATVYPRAIYVTGQPGEMSSVLDNRRFEKFKHILSPEKLPVLQLTPDYITIWGYWRGLDDQHAPDEIGYWTPVNAMQAFANGIIALREMHEIVERQRAVLANAGFEDVNLKADHVLLSYIPGGSIKRDAEGKYELRHCNMEMVTRI